MLRFSCSLVLVLASSAALAQNSTTTVKPVPGTTTGITPTPISPSLAEFDDLDRNRDGFVAKEEVPVTHDISRAWTILDQNLDGRLAREEFVAYNPEEGYD